MEIIINLFNNWTTFEKVNTLILILIILIVIPGLVWIFTKQAKLAHISFDTLVIAGLLTLITLLITNQFFNIAISYTYKLIPFIVFFITILCIGTMTGFYMQNHKQREFDMTKVKNEAFNDAFRLTISCILLFTAFALLTPSILLPVLLSLGLSLVIIWINYLLVCKLLK
ncbi:MAG: hypothetical protein UR96_C0003G0026 [candidate division WS6 bacterium GW2011_GWC1_36_11]|uniref:Uncharacterized protein n=2 Tax=Candidatus Dojkabacteria TaxID=74243 RepID=A0A0G0FZW4_9BACT|nr:MAG: hypothetical protein UR96_C0003G0026 [candidate division WS6 bacterium GW2011_GWC1_36_11]KKQ04347.1 MAG: hypothetical protein US14_C0014G0004 [candidate division WS6 bacterium GW2011_WS6_36_26]KKQ11128.1 MAG: hypothetical protein US23_C0008G0008 [candidate division WS6 bacterium GW2011_GWE1_36_69]KKQ16979.1 MAG: hypothetical protein US29_C0014G0010 [candidate division WS6 bacterium GW2011_GWF1_36_8]HAM37407.1 hypothetical protein [Patescibacteria group bacterium]